MDVKKYLDGEEELNLKDHLGMELSLVPMANELMTRKFSKEVAERWLHYTLQLQDLQLTTHLRMMFILFDERWDVNIKIPHSERWISWWCNNTIAYSYFRSRMTELAKRVGRRDELDKETVVKTSVYPNKSAKTEE
jgi:hypothetical protein